MPFRGSGLIQAAGSHKDGDHPLRKTQTPGGPSRPERGAVRSMPKPIGVVYCHRVPTQDRRPGASLRDRDKWYFACEYRCDQIG